MAAYDNGVRGDGNAWWCGADGRIRWISCTRCCDDGVINKVE